MKKILLTIVLFLVLANVEFGDVAQIIGDYYSIDKGKVYYRNKILEGANPKTVELIGFSLLKDDKNVYYMDEKIKDVKIKNFEKLGQNYWKNNNKIYYWDKKIENADIMSFKILNEDYAKDKNNVYDGNEKRQVLGVQINSLKYKKHILVINTHLDYGSAVKSTQIDDLMTVIDYFKGDVKFLCGDFNLLPTTEHYQKISENWNDTYFEVKDLENKPNLENRNLETERIDYIMAKKDANYRAKFFYK